VEIHVKAFLLYQGTTLLPTRTKTTLLDYLPFLDLKKIDDYAWGSAVLADIKRSMLRKLVDLSSIDFLISLPTQLLPKHSHRSMKQSSNWKV
jgi:hypothetical protein